MEPRDYPILAFASTREAVIEPGHHRPPIDAPEHAVGCFFQDVITRLSQEHRATVIHHMRSELGTHPLYELDVEGRRLAVFHPGVGGPLAAGLLQDVIALGCGKIIACGGAGVLDAEIAVGHIIVPVAAVRDEGTSYHYVPPAREVDGGAHACAVQRWACSTWEAYLALHPVACRWVEETLVGQEPAM